jgi:hypothetical protein
VSGPSLADLRKTAAVFNGFANVDTAWLRLAEDIKPPIDLSRADHRLTLLRLLNSWGCRIRYPRAGEPAPFDTGMAAWWRRHRQAAAWPPPRRHRFRAAPAPRAGVGAVDHRSVRRGRGRGARARRPPWVSLAKLLDEYLYVTITMAGQRPGPVETDQRARPADCGQEG